MESSGGPILLFHVGTNSMVKQNPGKIKQDFRALGAQVKGAGARVVFFFVLPDRSLLQAEVNPSCRSIPGFMAGVVTRALVSVIMGSPSTNTAYMGETGSTYPGKKIFASRWADVANIALN